MKHDFSALRQRLLSCLQELGGRVEACTKVRSQLGANENAHFPVRAYLSFLRHRSGDEIAVTADLKSETSHYVFECDILKPRGEVLAELGPFEIAKGATAADFAAATASWLSDFETFLEANFRALCRAVTWIDS
jgi:hypothetical protein